MAARVYTRTVTNRAPNYTDHLLGQGEGGGEREKEREREREREKFSQWEERKRRPTSQFCHS